MSIENQKTKSKALRIIWSVLRWIISVILIIFGIAFIFAPGDPAVVGVALVFIGALFIPQITRFFERKLSVSFSDGFRELKVILKPKAKGPTTLTDGLPGAGIITHEVKETKCTCAACGNTWFYGKQDKREQTANEMHNVGKSLLTCGTCGTPLGCLFWLMPEKKVVDLGKCSKCGSKAVKKEVVIHHV